MPSFSKRKILLLGFLLVILLVIPLTVYLVQQQQQSQSRANPNTTLSFSPATQPGQVGGKVSFDILVAPGNNQVNFIKLALKYDSTKLQATGKSFALDPASNLSIIQAASVGTGTLSVTLGVGSDPTKVIQQNTKIGSITFDVINPSDVPTQVSFDSNAIQIRSINGSNQDAFNENVFLNGAPAEVTIQGDAGSPTPTETLSVTPSITPAETPSVTPDLSITPSETPIVTGDGTTSPGANQAPICESLAIDRATTGTAPYSVTFTATGNDTDGTISKVTFNYGDGTTEDVTTGGNIGTNSVTLPKAHTYQNSGSFTATALLTDDKGGVSNTSTCSVAMTISGGGSTTEAVTPLAATGPSTAVVGAGALGGVLFLIGALLFLAL